MVQEFLLWCTLINYGILLVWFLAFTLAHDWIHRLHSKWFRLSMDQFDAIKMPASRSTKSASFCSIWSLMWPCASWPHSLNRSPRARLTELETRGL
jgi:hypothetical protein